MSLNDSLADALSKINNATKALKSEVILKKSKLLLNVLDVLKSYNYVGDYEIIEDGKQGLVKLNLINNINKCGVIKPRTPTTIEELEMYERRFLPAKDFGILIITTNRGLLTQKEAIKEEVGGFLLAYCY